jgi:predicted HicB family RNase H-like nuclease
MPQQTQPSIHVRLPPALHDQLRTTALDQGMSLNSLVVALLAGSIGFKLEAQ